MKECKVLQEYCKKRIEKAQRYMRASIVLVCEANNFFNLRKVIM